MAENGHLGRLTRLIYGLPRGEGEAMGVQLAKYDPNGPGAPASDQLVSLLLHSDETVEAAGYGDLVVPMFGRHRGKTFVTTTRLVLVPDRSVFPYPFWWRPWRAFSRVRLQGVLWNARISLIHDHDDRLGSLAVETTKALAREIERAWTDHRDLPFGGDWAAATVLNTGKFHCRSCGFNPDDALRCGACGRRLQWEGILGRAVAAAHDPASTLPESFSDGSRTNRSFILESLATLAAAAAAEGKDRWLSHVNDLLDTMAARRYAPASSFGVMPQLHAIRDHENSQRLWEVMRKYPERLAGASPVPEQREGEEQAGGQGRTDTGGTELPWDA